MIVLGVALTLVLGGWVNNSGATSLAFDAKAALRTSQSAIGHPVSNHRFTGTGDRVVSLTEYLGRPLVVNLVYTSCLHTCPLIVQRLDRAIPMAEAALGPNRFAVVTIGFDTRNDSPARMEAYASAQGIRRPNWRFLSADADTMERLASELGFVFAATPAGFDHLAQVTVLDAKGQVFRQIYGDDFAPQLVVEALKDLTVGRPAIGTMDGLIDRIRYICTVYDPTRDRYRFSYGIFMGLVIGFLSLAATAAFVVREWLHGRKA